MTHTHHTGHHTGPADPLAGLPYADRVRTVTTAQALGWLRAGWMDLRASGWVSLAYGALFVALGFALTGGLVRAGMAYLIAPMIGAFLLIAPLLALGLYRISKDVEEGRRPSLWRALTAWRANPYHILTAGLILMLYVMIWARMNVVAFALFFPHEAIALDHFVAQMFSLDGLVFTVFITALGFAFAAFAFITNVTALPMMMDRPVDVFAAALASAMAVLRNPRVLALWAGLIVLVTGAGLLTGFLGLIVALPLVGHASWHAYRDLIKEDEEG
ncbi:DUF2189 domain-containing protein [Azospirillum brasilense]|uniref:DUF2189 domain-containing protein n=1 Tax=Azospirillum argentinense TaxID=2970906 RepID=UPI00190E98E7|nr:DUF2189 domain-containing protein [Azospirillum argentinense]MBK3801345.1 DUF2189 domain-containing protein [Azospirillum argentinense]